MPAFSPDGGSVAYTVHGRESDGAPAVELYVRSVGTPDDKLLVHRPGDLVDLVWSPQGDRIALVTDVSRIAALGASHDRRLAVIVDVESGQMQPFKPGPAAPGSLSWLPDGERIVFDSAEEPGIFVARIDGSEVLRLSDDGSQPACSPLDERIVFKRHGRMSYGIWIMDADGGEQRKLASSPTGPPYTTGPLRWSPNGEVLAWWAIHDMWPVVTVMPVSGAEPRQVATIYTWEPAYIPRDGQASLRTIWQLLTGGNARPGGDGYTFHFPQVSQIAWAPDSARIAYTSKIPEQLAAEEANELASMPLTLLMKFGAPLAFIGAVYGWWRWGPDWATVWCASVTGVISVLVVFVVLLFRAWDW